MKKITFLIVFATFWIQTHGQPSENLWTVETPDFETSDVVASNGRLYTAATNYSFAKFYAYENDGALLYTVDLTNYFNVIGLTVDNTQQYIYATGSTSSSDASLLTKINAATGAIEWSNSLDIADGTTGWSSGSAVDSNNNVITINRDNNNAYYRVVKHDEDGTIIWDNNYTVTGDSTFPRDVIVDDNDNIIVAGQADSRSFVLMSIDPDGVLNWNVTDDSTPNINPTSLVFTDDNAIAVAGSNGYNTLQFARKYDTDGNLLWSFTETSEDGPTTCFAIEQDEAGNLLLLGGYDRAAQFVFNLTIRALDNTDGSMLWTFIDDQLDFGSVDVSDLAILSDGNLAAVGYFYDSDTSLYTGYTIGYAYEASLSLNEENLSKFNIYPNPVSNELNIAISNFNTSKEYKIVNLLGQVVQKGNLDSFSNRLDISGISNGNYVLTISDETNKSLYSHKLIIQN